MLEYLINKEKTWWPYLLLVFSYMMTYTDREKKDICKSAESQVFIKGFSEDFTKINSFICLLCLLTISENF